MEGLRAHTQRPGSVSSAAHWEGGQPPSHRLVERAAGINIKMSVGEQASVHIKTTTVLDVSAAETNFLISLILLHFPSECPLP